MSTELERLQGAWTIVSLEVEGKTVSEVAFSGSQIVMEDNRFTTVSMGAGYSGTFEANANTTPTTLDMMFTEGPHTGHASLAIYELNGDILKLCIGFAGRERPTAFETAPGRGHALEILKREPGGTESTTDGEASRRSEPPPT